MNGPFRAGMLTAQEAFRLNRAFEPLFARVGQFTAAASAGGATVIEDPTGATILSTEPEEFWIKITAGPSSSAYTWREQVRDTATTWADNPWGLSGSPSDFPAYEVNGNLVVPAGTVVRAWWSEGGGWLLFEYQPPGLTVEDEWTTPSTATDVTHIKLVTNPDDTVLNTGFGGGIFLWSNAPDNYAQIGILGAGFNPDGTSNPDQPGVVTADTGTQQVFYGDKFFAGTSGQTIGSYGWSAYEYGVVNPGTADYMAWTPGNATGTTGGFFIEDNSGLLFYSDNDDVTLTGSMGAGLRLPGADPVYMVTDSSDTKHVGVWETTPAGTFSGGLKTGTGSGTWGLASGGTGVSLSDPGADRLMFWDDSAGQVAWLVAGSGLSISGTTITASGSAPTLDAYSVLANDTGSSTTGTSLAVGTDTLPGALVYDYITGDRLAWRQTSGNLRCLVVTEDGAVSWDKIHADFWDGADLQPDQGGTGLNAYATGDMLYASGADTLAALAAGTDDYVLTMASGVPTWAANAGPVGTPDELCMFGPGGTIVGIGPGSDGDFLTVTGGTWAPAAVINAGYTPSTSTDWTGVDPASIQQALDRLAAAFTNNALTLP